MPTVVATSSRREPKSASNRSSESSPPAPAMTATVIADTSDVSAMARCPFAKATCTIAQQAAANAITATVVWMKSSQVNSGP
jgi:hypothetical protein